MTRDPIRAFSMALAAALAVIGVVSAVFGHGRPPATPATLTVPATEHPYSDGRYIPRGTPPVDLASGTAAIMSLQ